MQNVQTIIIRANLGGIDKYIEDVEQSVACDYITYTDENLPPRYCSMTPRLQAKIPKFFAWQLQPDYDFYLWLDGNLRLAHKDSLKYLLEQIEDYDVVVLRHKDRDTIYWEYRYNKRGLTNNAPSNYLRKRYAGELLEEQFNEINNYADSPLYQGGVFIYRNTPEVHKMLKEMWYACSRYCIMDQLAWAYLLKKSGLRVRTLPDNFADCWWLENRRHAK